ncbi:MAG: hypothetical protein ACE5R6_08835 [Candidatus Heimdallarchaeota archaeon]
MECRKSLILEVQKKIKEVLSIHKEIAEFDVIQFVNRFQNAFSELEGVK